MVSTTKIFKYTLTFPPIMSLTEETLRTPLTPGLYPAKVREDVTYMDVSQLEAFVRGLAAGESPPALSFLPNHFWREPLDAHSSIDTSVGAFFSGLRGTIGPALEGRFTDNGRRLNFDSGYVARIDEVIAGIADECLRYQGSPTKKELLLAQVVIDFAQVLGRGDLDRTNNPAYNAAVRLAQDNRYSGLKRLDRI